MADDKKNRVEVRLSLAGRGMSATPDRIAEMQQQVAQHEKLTKAKPTRSFAAVLNSKIPPAPRALSEKEKRYAALPAKGPKPSIVHPDQRDVFGRAEDDIVVLKG